MVGSRDDEHVVLGLLVVETRCQREDAGGGVEGEHLVAPLREQAVRHVCVLVLVSVCGGHLSHLVN